MITIQTIGYDGQPLYIARDKVLGFYAHRSETMKTVVCIACGSKSEEWIIGEEFESFRIKFDGC